MASISSANSSTARTTDKTHGRLEQRTITISSELKEYLDWPYCEQVFKLERHVVRIKDSKVMDEVVYGLTSLTTDEGGPEQILGFVRGQWGIENGLHYRRDATLRRLVLCADRQCAAEADADQQFGARPAVTAWRPECPRGPKTLRGSSERGRPTRLGKLGLTLQQP